eukprot:1859308-Amphidinium_carterae.2
MAGSTGASAGGGNGGACQCVRLVALYGRLVARQAWGVTCKVEVTSHACTMAGQVNGQSKDRHMHCSQKGWKLVARLCAESKARCGLSLSEAESVVDPLRTVMTLAAGEAGEEP